jgi:BASS family bile acid:Na+ symporter
MISLETAHIHFSPSSLWALNIALAFLMFAVSLFIEREQVADLRRNPRALAVGLLAQWFYMPVLAVVSPRFRVAINPNFFDKKS